MLDTMSSSDDASQGSLPTPAVAVAELLQVVPRLVDRTLRQADMARSLLGALPCLGGSTSTGATEDPVAEAPVEPEHEQVDVLSVLADDGTDEVAPETPAPVTAARDALEDVAAAAPPSESDLPIQDYDSLAASQVVPRLATLAPEELRAVQRYEQATRHRQTILHRVAQLLSD
jgi:hypothetical protein